MRQRVFIGSSGEALDISYAVQGELDRDFDVTVWNQDVFRLSHDALDSLLQALDSSDAGVFILKPDDVTESRGESRLTVRDNVTFELGMFIGRLGRDRTFMLLPSEPAIQLPSDLAGIITARYDPDRFDHEPSAAVGPACSQIRRAIRTVQVRMDTESRPRVRLDRAMSRMSRDLELLLADRAAPAEDRSSTQWPDAVTLRLNRADVCIEAGRIQDYLSDDSRAVIALPANEYFDDKCISDTNSTLGAFIQHHFSENVAGFVRQVKAELRDVPAQRVARAERNVDDSYGIGEAVFLSVPPAGQLILVSATTERTGIGLRAEPHFLYAALEGVAETMNERRLNSLTMPVLGSGHGGMPLPIALLFNLLAVRSILTENLGRHMRKIRIVVFDRNADEISRATMDNIVSYM
ncbi:MAG TPA: TIR domain-containing protein [Streptosporangiaceae bacterium]